MLNKKMKLAAAAVLMGCVSSTHANMIDLTPGGFDRQGPYPKVYNDWITHKWNKTAFLLGQNYQNQWITTGLGEPYFSATLEGQSTINFTWDLTGITDYRLHWVMVVSATGVNLYKANGNSLWADSATFTVDGTSPILSLVIYGSNPDHVPDAGSSLLFFGLSLIGLFYARH